MPRPVSAQTRNENFMRVSATRRLRRANDPVEKIRLLCLQRGYNGILGLGRAFRRLDKDKSGNLTFGEFKKGLLEIGLSNSITEDEVEEVFYRFDADKSGTLSFDEFLRAVRPPMSVNRMNIVEKAFRKLDKTGDGVITYHDLKDTFNVHYHPLYQNGQLTEKELFLRFLSNFEVGGNPDGIVTKDEFFDYYTGVSASIDEDAYFDLMVRLAWKL